MLGGALETDERFPLFICSGLRVVCDRCGSSLQRWVELPASVARGSVRNCPHQQVAKGIPQARASNWSDSCQNGAGENGIEQNFNQ
jgi:hypothetical protein